MCFKIVIKNRSRCCYNLRFKAYVLRTTALKLTRKRVPPAVRDINLLAKLTLGQGEPLQVFGVPLSRVLGGGFWWNLFATKSLRYLGTLNIVSINNTDTLIVYRVISKYSLIGSLKANTLTIMFSMRF